MKTRAELLLWGGLAALTAAAIVGLWMPIIQGGRAISQEIERLQSELAKPSDSPERIAKMQVQRDELSRLGRGRTAEIPAEAEVAGLVQTLSTKLDALGLGRREITTGAPQRLDEAQSLPVTITVEAPFEALMTLLREVEGLPRLVRVQRLRLALPNERSKREQLAEGVLRSDFVLDAFFGGPGEPTTSQGPGTGKSP